MKLNVKKIKAAGTSKVKVEHLNLPQYVRGRIEPGRGPPERVRSPLPKTA